MSTKAIRQALRLMQEIQGHSTALTHAAALAELEAIEKAAADISKPTHRATEDYFKAQELMAAIARQGGAK